MISLLIKSLITAYQRWLSPRKGFSCAHRILHGEHSCSGYALQILYVPLKKSRNRKWKEGDLAKDIVSAPRLGGLLNSYQRRAA